MADMKFMMVLALGAAVLGFPSQGYAQESVFFNAKPGVQYGVAKGGQAPHDLTGKDQYDRSVNLRKLSGEKGVVLYIVRSAEWSRSCVFQLEEVSQKGAMIEDEGFNVVVVSHDDANQLARFTRKYDFPYPAISDPDSEIIKAFGVMNTSYLPGTSYYGVAHPVVYFISKDGVVLEKLFHEDARVRPNVEDILLIARNLNMDKSAVKR